MAALAVTHPTLLDLAKARQPDGQIAPVIEILNQTNEVLDYWSFVEGNLPTGHMTTIRSGLPEPTWRSLYQGVQPTKSRRAQITDTCGMMEAYAEVDAKLVELNGNAPAFRLSEDKAHLEGMSQELASTFFYGNEGTEPAAFTGLAPRYNSLSAENADNIIVGGSSDTDNASIWLCVFADTTLHGIVPKGSVSGMKVEDKGRVTSESAGGSNTLMEVYRTHYALDAGLCLRDWRYVVRICNIERSALLPTAATGADLADLMFQAIDLIPNLNAGRPVFFMDRTVRGFLRRQMASKLKDSSLTLDMVGGKRVMAYQEIPIARCDALAADEAVVS